MGGHPVTEHESGILKLHAKGVGAAEIARRFGVSRSTVYRCFARHGIHRGVGAEAEERDRDTRHLLTEMLRHLNGIADRDRILKAMSDYEEKYL